MINDLTVTLIQTELHWQNREANFAMFDEKIAAISTPTDLIVLPEMFTTGFTMDARGNAQLQDGEQLPLAVHKMKEWARSKDAAVCGSVIVEENGQFFNRMYFVEPNGYFHHYDKRHLFRMADEHEHYSGGKEKIIISYRGWNICPLICYDLRFPVWSRNVKQEYDLLIYVANWPAPRRNAWRTLLKARSVENLAYCVGVNRVGTDGKDIDYAGDSAFIDYKGDVIEEYENREMVFTQTLSKNELVTFREKFPAHLDADMFKIM